MPIEKRCISTGCDQYPMFGMGTPSSGLMRWACSGHRHIIWNGAAQAPGEGGSGEVPHPNPPSPPMRQGRLL